MKSVYKDKYRRRSIGRQRQERGAGFVPRLNRTFVSSIGLHRISLVRASEESFKTGLFDALARVTVVFWANRPIGVLSCPSPPRRTAVRCPDSTRQWYVQALDSTSCFGPTSRRRGTTLAFRTPGGRPAELAISRLHLDPESR